MFAYTQLASLVAKKKCNKLYYYVVETARIEGKPRIAYYAYLGTAEMVRDRTAPIPWPLPPAILACPPPCERPPSKPECGTCSLPSAPDQAPDLSPHYLLLVALRRICQHGPKTRVAEWYIALPSCRAVAVSRRALSSQAFWNAFEQIVPQDQAALSPAGDPLEQGQLRLLGLWKEKQLVSRRVNPTKCI